MSNDKKTSENQQGDAPLAGVVLSPTILGFALIFISIHLLGKTEFLSWEMFVQIVMVAAGGSLIANKRD